MYINHPVILNRRVWGVCCPQSFFFLRNAFHSFRFPATSPFESCVPPFVQNSLDHTVPRSLYTIRLRVSSSIYSASLASRRFLFAYHLSFVPGCQSHISFLFSSIYRRSNPSPLSYLINAFHPSNSSTIFLLSYFSLTSSC